MKTVSPRSLTSAFSGHIFLFNIEQTEGLETLNETLIETEPSDPFFPNAAAESLLRSSGANIIHRFADEAFYHPIRDLIQLPTKAQFHDQGGYYATALHELTHWTGHHSRLQREGVTTPCPFGSPGYAFEELIAEMGGPLFYVPTPVYGESFGTRAISTPGSACSRLTTARFFRASGQARCASEYVLNLEQQRKQTVMDDSRCMNDGA